MKSFYYLIGLSLLSLPYTTMAQQISTLASVTANGGVTVDSDGMIYAAHFGPLPPNPNIGKNIFKITPEGEVNTFVSNALNVGTGNDIDADGFLYQANFSTNTIFKISPEGVIVDNNFATIPGPVGIHVNNNGNVFVAACGDNNIYQITPDGTTSVFSGGGFNCANGITSDFVNLYITNFNDGFVSKISPDGERTTVGDTGFGNGHIAYRAVDQMLYIASYSGNRIFRMDLEGNVSVFAGNGQLGTNDADNLLDATFTRPNGINFNRTMCSLYITQDGNVLREIKFFDGRCDPPTSIKELQISTNVRIFPNPAEESITLKNPDNISFNNVEIFDSLGRQVFSTQKISSHFDISTLSKGIFLLVLTTTDNQQYREKLIIQ